MKKEMRSRCLMTACHTSVFYEDHEGRTAGKGLALKCMHRESGVLRSIAA
jgi:hypothetical protein